jgi:hypothetical protein
MVIPCPNCGATSAWAELAVARTIARLDRLSVERELGATTLVPEYSGQSEIVGDSEDPCGMTCCACDSTWEGEDWQIRLALDALRATFDETLERLP